MTQPTALPRSTDDHQEVELLAGDYRAIVSPIGGALRALTYQGLPLTETFSAGEEPPFACNVVLAPWPNRIEDGEYTWNGRHYALELSEPSRRNAIHGFALNQAFDVINAGLADGEPGHGALELRLDSRPGWPWPLRVGIDVTLTRDGLTMTYSVTNEGSTVAPWAFGVHAYLNPAGEPLDASVATVPVQTTLPLSADRLLPSGPERPAPAAGVDLAAGQLMDGVLLDHCFRGAASNEPRVVTVRAPSGRGVRMTCGPEFGWFQVYVTDDRADGPFPGRGRALAVEPMTCPPNALRSGENLGALEPGQTRSTSLSLSAL